MWCHISWVESAEEVLLLQGSVRTHDSQLLPLQWTKLLVL